MTSKGTVLVTGANGYLAGQTIAAFIEAGFSVRGTVRSLPSAEVVTRAVSEFSDALEIVQIPDITLPGAFDEAMKGIHAIAHLASPNSFELKDPERMIKITTSAINSLMESAIKEPTVKAVVLMSSMGTMLDRTKQAPYRYTEADWDLAVVETATRLGANCPGGLVYRASKVAMERAFWSFKARKPSFSMTAINPAFFIGPPLAAKSADAINPTTRWIWEIFSGQDIPPLLYPTAGFVDVRDAAVMIVWSVKHRDHADGQRFLMSKGSIFPKFAADVLRKAYPQRAGLIKEGTGPAHLPGYAYPDGLGRDGSKYVRYTGKDYYTFEQTILDMAKFLERFL